LIVIHSLSSFSALAPGTDARPATILLGLQYGTPQDPARRPLEPVAGWRKRVR
jgi:hypothetical protein